jgi:hypothetical protein
MSGAHTAPQRTNPESTNGTPPNFTRSRMDGQRLREGKRLDIGNARRNRPVTPVVADAAAAQGNGAMVRVSASEITPAEQSEASRDAFFHALLGGADQNLGANRDGHSPHESKSGSSASVPPGRRSPQQRLASEIEVERQGDEDAEAVSEDSMEKGKAPAVAQQAETLAGFDYTYNSWDKIRPRLLAKTGLGRALKAYEGSKHDLRNGKEVIIAYTKASKALELVETAREKAIATCGESRLFKSAKTALEAARDSHEILNLRRQLEERITETLGSFPDQADRVAQRYQSSLQILTEALNQYEETGVIQPEGKQHVESEILKPFLGVIQFQEAQTVKVYIARKNAFNAPPALVARCEHLLEQIVSVDDLRGKVEEALRKLKPIVLNAGHVT